MAKKRKVRQIQAKNVHHLFLGLTLLVLGILVLWKQTDFLMLALLIVSLVVVVAGVAQIVNFFLQKRQKPLLLLAGAAELGLGAVMVFFPAVPKNAIPILFAAYILMNSVVKLVDSFFIIRNRAEGELLYSLLPGIFYLIFALIILLTPWFHVRAVLITIGVYCLLLAVTYIMDFVRSLIPVKAKQGLKRRVRVTLPIFLAAFIPHTVLTKLNAFLSEGEHSAGEFEDLGEQRENERPDLEIFIHVASDGFCAIGHCDICFDGELIAYGNYDEASSTPLGTGDGVLIVTNKRQYLPFCLNFNKTTVFSFGLRLNEEQKASIRGRIDEIRKDLVPWSPFENPKNDQIFAAQFARIADVRYYKFRSGKFKTYFVMSTNCVLLAESIVCRAGTDILNVNGIISPGTFYDYLESEFLRKDSMVISRRVYKLPLTEEDVEE